MTIAAVDPVQQNLNDPFSGIIDSSGITFHVTRDLRRYDAGIMETGLEYTDKYALPPGLELWPISGYCIPECTEVVSYGSRNEVPRFTSQL